MKMNFLRRLALLCAVLTCGMLLALPAAAEADAPYAEDGDMDYIISRFQRQFPPRGKPRHAKKGTHLFLKDGCLFTQGNTA